MVIQQVDKKKKIQGYFLNYRNIISLLMKSYTMNYGNERIVNK